MSAAAFSQPSLASAAPARGNGLKALLARLSDEMAVIGAAIRVSRAVESRHQPAAADLDRLGLPSRLPGLSRI